MLSMLAVAIGIAVAPYAAFGVSFALGAFLARVVLNESEVDPAFLARQPGAIILVTLLVVIAKSLAAFARPAGAVASP